jgi:ribose transport system substrate-binding protein
MPVLTGPARVATCNIALRARLLKGAKFDTDLFLPTFFVSASDIPQQVGLDTISPQDAEKEAQGFREQFGPDQDDKAMSSGGQ